MFQNQTKRNLKPQMRVMPLPILGAKCKWKPVKRDKSTSRDFVACGRRLRGQTRLAPLTERSTCGKSRIAGNKDYFTSSAWQNTEEKVKLYQGIKKPHYSNINQAERQSSNQRPSPSIHRHSLSTLPHLVVQGEIQIMYLFGSFQFPFHNQRLVAAGGAMPAHL